MKTPLLLAAVLLFCPAVSPLARAESKPVIGDHDIIAPLPRVRLLKTDAEPEPESTPPTANAAEKALLAKTLSSASRAPTRATSRAITSRKPTSNGRAGR
jgi:hypothetical protein